MISILLLILLFQDGSRSADIDKKVHQINASVDACLMTEYLDADFYDNAGNVITYEGRLVENVSNIKLRRCDIDNNVKISLAYDGAQMSVFSEYYACKGKLIFVCQRTFLYRLPKWHDDFDEKKAEVVENGYYIEDNKLFKWTKSSGSAQAEKDLLEKEKTIFHDFQTYLSYRE